MLINHICKLIMMIIIILQKPHHDHIPLYTVYVLFCTNMRLKPITHSRLHQTIRESKKLTKKLYFHPKTATP